MASFEDPIEPHPVDRRPVPPARRCSRKAWPTAGTTAAFGSRTRSPGSR